MRVGGDIRTATATNFLSLSQTEGAKKGENRTGGPIYQQIRWRGALRSPGSGSHSPAFTKLAPQKEMEAAPAGPLVAVCVQLSHSFPFLTFPTQPPVWPCSH